MLILYRGINSFTMEEFNEVLEKKATVVVFMKNVNCLTCESDRWTVSKLNYNFMLRKNVPFLNYISYIVLYP